MCLVERVTFSNGAKFQTDLNGSDRLVVWYVLHGHTFSHGGGGEGGRGVA